MDASKENCRQALEIINSLVAADQSTSPEDDADAKAKTDFIRDFLKAAEKRLPSQAAIDRDKERCKKNPPRRLRYWTIWGINP